MKLTYFDSSWSQVEINFVVTGLKDQGGNATFYTWLGVGIGLFVVVATALILYFSGCLKKIKFFDVPPEAETSENSEEGEQYRVSQLGQAEPEEGDQMLYQRNE